MSLYAYDQGLLNYLKEALCFDNIINSAESVAFDNAGERTEKVKVNLPMISFWRTANSVVEGGGNFPMRHRGLITSQDFESATGVRWRALLVTLSYQITIWSDKRREVDEIYRELIMYLMTDNPHIKVLLEGMDQPEMFEIQVTDTDAGTDVDSFPNNGRLYTQHIMIDIPEARLLFSREYPITKNMEIRSVAVDNLGQEP